jgi:hypothetical protein
MMAYEVGRIHSIHPLEDAKEALQTLFAKERDGI